MSDWLMKNKIRFLIVCILLCSLLLAFNVPGVEAQASDLTLGLNLPNEGETFYAGPSSLLYNIPIEGWVQSLTYTPSEISVVIDVYRDSILVVSQPLIPESNGVFKTYAQLNPGAYTIQFAAEFIPCGDTCHIHPSDMFASKEWDQSIYLPVGPLQFIITATDPAGHTASLERNITVDRSGYAIIPVQVQMINDMEVPVQDIPVSASAWIYIWRSRIFSSGTDAGGLANMKVEALAEATTTYRFEVKPTIMDGILYESINPVDIVLPAKATSAPLVTLQVKASLASIQGKLVGDLSLPEMTIWAVPDDYGPAITTKVDSTGNYYFKNLPIGKYTLMADKDQLGALGLEMDDVKVDLTRIISASVNLELTSLDGYSCQGVVLDKQGNSLPFAWGVIGNIKYPVQASPASGQFTLFGLPEEKVKLVISAPGFFSKTKVIDPGSKACSELEFKLVKQPETRTLVWGDGSLIVSPETHISQSDQHIFLEKGWLWGQNSTDEEITIQIGTVEISLSSGRFALEDIPGRITLFYLLDGNARVSTIGSSISDQVPSGSLIILDESTGYHILPYDHVLVGSYNMYESQPGTTIFEPSLISKILNRFALLGIDLAQLVTYVTYAAIVLSIILLPFVLLYRWMKRKKLKN
jgi:hypothetical protein